jgi:hypothetical protein
MSTQSIGSYGYTSAYTKLREKAEEAKLYATAEQADKSTAANTSETSSPMGKQIMDYLSEIPKGDDGTLSFKDVDEYRKKLETEWDVEVSSDLLKLGVDITQQLPLSYDPATGKVTVSKSHPDKAKIDAYFESNQDKVDEFEKILQLGKLTTTADEQLSQTEMGQNIQQQSLAWWFEDNSDPTTWFSGGGMMAGQGLSSYTGINIKV